jgi:hypothetical protein
MGSSFQSVPPRSRPDIACRPLDGGDLPRATVSPSDGPADVGLAGERHEGDERDVAVAGTPGRTDPGQGSSTGTGIAGSPTRPIAMASHPVRPS